MGVLQAFLFVFREVYELTNRVSGTGYVTSNSFLDDICIVYGYLCDLENSNNVELQSMAAKMRSKFDKYWGSGDKVNFLLYFSSILDPRKKLEFIEFCFGEMYYAEVASELLGQVRVAFMALFDEYKSRLTPPSHNTYVSVSISNKTCVESGVSGLNSKF